MTLRALSTCAGAFSLLLICSALPAQTPSVTPTVTQFLNASNAEYVLGGVPEGLTPFEVNGVQLKLTDDVTGAVAATWVTPKQQVVIAYQGTSGGEYLITNPAALLAQVLADTEVSLSTINVAAPALVSSLRFAKIVETAAKLQGYTANNIFVTGHSLGGIEAAYVSSQTGFGGIGFEGSGLGLIAAKGNAKLKGSNNFVNIVTWGDPVGNISSDIPGDLMGYTSGGGGRNPHYGGIVVIGDPSDQATLNIATVIPNLIEYHLPGVQAHDLGITLDPYSANVDNIGDLTGRVYSIGNATIPELLMSAKGMGFYYPG